MAEQETSERAPHGVVDDVLITAGRGYLRCLVGSVWLALPVEVVQEVCERVEATPVPLTGPHVLGVFNLRGRVVPLLDLGRFLEQQEPHAVDAAAAGGDERTPRVVVLSAERMCVGVTCDRVSDVVLADSPRPALTGWAQRLRKFALGELDLGSQLALVLDVPRVLQEARVGR